MVAFNMASYGKTRRIQRAEERAKLKEISEKRDTSNPILIELTEKQEQYNVTHWKGYPVGKTKCHCGANIYISRRGILKGWSGIECCSCGNLIENCACGGLLPTKETVRRIIDENSFN